MAIKRKKKERKADNSNNLPLMNEKLIKKMMSLQSDSCSPKDIQVRLVVDKSSISSGSSSSKDSDADSESDSDETTTTTTTSPTTKSEVMSLAEAIELSLDQDLDLVEVDLRDTVEIPVIRAEQYDAKVYKATKHKKTTKNNKKKDPSSVVKEFRFKAKTADNDFQRKVNNIKEALKKGYKCKVSATCPSRVVLSGSIPGGALEVIQRIVKSVGSTGEAFNPPEINKEKTNASILLVPPPTKRNKNTSR